MSEITLESQLFEIIENKDMSEKIKLAKLDMLVKLGVDVNAKEKSWWEKTALMKASEKGHKEVVEFLVFNGADVNAWDISGDTALMVASTWGMKRLWNI